MRLLIPFLTLIATVSTIVTAWWNLAIRKRYVEARITSIGTDAVESEFARWTRRILTGIVAFFLGSGLLLGGFIFLKALWELFS